MTPAEHKEFVLEAWRNATPGLMARYIEALAGDGADVDDLRKAVELMVRTTGAEVEKKSDPNSNLPVFQVVFNGPSIQATMTVAPATPQIEAVQAELLEPVIDVQAKPVAPARPEPDFSDADELLSALDDQLKAFDD